MALNQDFSAYLTGNSGTGGGFNSYAAGDKQYGPGRMAPNIGASDKAGYQVRDQRAGMMRNALLRRMQAMQSGDYASPAAQRPLLGTPYPYRSGGY